MTTSGRLLFWVPRILIIVFAAFLGVFALDVFGAHTGFWKTALALFMHLIPTWIMLIILAVSWHRAWIGGIVYPVLGMVYLLIWWGRFSWGVYVVVTGPLFLAGILFWIDWWSGRAVKSGARA